MKKFFNWLKRRIKEPSTLVAIGAVILGIPPEVVQAAAIDLDPTAIGISVAALGAIAAEKGSEE